MSEFTIPANELSRLTHNALAFMPARSAVKVCRVQLAGCIFSLTATDLFTVGHDWTEVVSMDRASIDLSREDLQALDKIARSAKKDDVLLWVRDQDGLQLCTPSIEGTVRFLDSSAQRNPEDLWERCDELLTRLEGADDGTVPGYLTIDPKMLSAFGKVKPSDGKECIADLCFRGSEGQILVKIGATFRGAIMPVDRDEASRSESVGTEGLWQGE